MVVDQNQPGPVRPSKWAKPNNSACLTFFPINFSTVTWAKPNNWALLFNGFRPFYCILIMFFSHYILQLVPLVRQVLLVRWVHLVILSNKLVPHIISFEICQIITRTWSHQSGFHITHYKITYILNISISVEKTHEFHQITLNQPTTIFITQSISTQMCLLQLQYIICYSLRSRASHFNFVRPGAPVKEEPPHFQSQ